MRIHVDEIYNDLIDRLQVQDNLYTNMFRDRPIRKKGIWTTRDGNEIPIPKMTDGHIKNAIKHLEKLYSAPEKNLRNWEIYKELVRERNRRELNDAEWDS